MTHLFRKERVMLFILNLFLSASFFAQNAFAASCGEPVPTATNEAERAVSAADELPLSASSTLTQFLNESLVSEEKSQLLTKAQIAEVTIDIDPEKRHQEIWGFGATITESCLKNMNALSAKDRKELMTRLFSKEQGANFNYLRLPIGANDFSLSDYTLADTPKNKDGEYKKDPELKYFNFKRDKQFADFAKEVMKINPDVKIMISPWTPPAWMKSPQKLRGGVLNPEAYDAFAKYIIKAVDAYVKAGITVHHLSILNEPLIGDAKEEWGFPQAFMDVEEQKKFLSKNLAPLILAREKTSPEFKTKVLLLDHNWDVMKPYADFYKDENIKAISGGLGVHCYRGHFGQAKEFMETNPEIPVMQTECTASIKDGNNGGSFRWWSENQTLDALRAGTAGALAWNICLDQKGEPRNNGCYGCRGMVTIDQSVKKKPKLIYNEEYFALAQTSKYVQRGAIRIESTESKEKGIVNVAFINPDNSRVVVLRNTKDVPVKVSVRDDNCQAMANVIPPGAALSLRWAPKKTTPPADGSRQPAARAE